MTPRAAIFGCAGPALTSWEAGFFAETDPFGFILFGRNCEAPDQIRALVAALRDCVGRADAPVLIDQEGGRVVRLKPPHWRAAPPAEVFGQLALLNPPAAVDAARDNALLIAAELAALGIDVDCAPVLDLRYPSAHDVIGDRAFGADPELVAALGRAACEGFLAGGVLPVVKHVPGHGRARVDSHHALPVVEAPLAELERSDFAPFHALADAPWAMTGHVVYTALDDVRPATTSPLVIGEVIRGTIGFAGVLVSDDLSMQALSGGLGERARDALAAGCDLALHCNGKPEEMRAVAAAAGPLGPESLARIAAARAQLRPVESVDLVALRERLDALLGLA